MAKRFINSEITLSGAAAPYPVTLVGSPNVLGKGVAFSGATLVGSGNAMGLRWGSPNIYGTIDNVVSAILGTVSDYRLKENVQPIESCLSKVLSLKPVSFSPKEFDGAVGESSELGFIAHELEEIFPQFVSGSKDGINEEGKAFYQSVNYAGITTVLTKAIQEQQAMIEELKAEIQQLKQP